MDTTQTTNGSGAVREGRRIIWWNVIIGLGAAVALYLVTPPYQIFIVLFLLIRILAIVFEYMLFLAFRQVAIFTALPGIVYAWSAAFLSTVAIYSYEVGEAAFHYGMNVSPYYQIPPNVFQGIEGIALLVLGYYFGKLPYGYGKLPYYGRLTHTFFGIALLIDGMVSGSASYSFLSPLTVWFGIFMFIVTVLVEYKILSRTLALQAQGSASYPPTPPESRTMFAHLADFGYVRTAKQAIGFYIVYFIMICTSFGVFVVLAGETFPSLTDPLTRSEFGAITSCIVSTLLAFVITKDRHALKRFSSIVLIILTIIISLYGKLPAGLALVAFMTTRRAGTIAATTAPTLPHSMAPAPAPFPPHHNPMHLAVSEDMKEEEVHINAATLPKNAAKKRVTKKTERLATIASVERVAKPARTVKKVSLKKEKKEKAEKTVLEEKLGATKDDTKVNTVVITNPVVRDAG